MDNRAIKNVDVFAEAAAVGGIKDEQVFERVPWIRENPEYLERFNTQKKRTVQRNFLEVPDSEKVDDEYLDKRNILKKQDEELDEQDKQRILDYYDAGDTEKAVGMYNARERLKRIKEQNERNINSAYQHNKYSEALAETMPFSPDEDDGKVEAVSKDIGRNVALGLGKGATKAVALGAGLFDATIGKIGEDTEYGRYLFDLMGDVSRGQGYANRESEGLPEIVSSSIGSAAESLPNMALGGVLGGQAGMAAIFGASGYQSGYYEALDAGLSEKEAMKHGAKEGFIEMSVMGLFSYLGAGGVEAKASQLLFQGGKGALKGATKGAIKGAGKTLYRNRAKNFLTTLAKMGGQELPEELITESLQFLNTLHPTEMTLENYKEVMEQTFLSTAFTTLGFSAPGVTKGGDIRAKARAKAEIGAEFGHKLGIEPEPMAGLVYQAYLESDTAEDMFVNLEQHSQQYLKDRERSKIEGRVLDDAMYGDRVGLATQVLQDAQDTVVAPETEQGTARENIEKANAVIEEYEAGVAEQRARRIEHEAKVELDKKVGKEVGKLDKLTDKAGIDEEFISNNRELFEEIGEGIKTSNPGLIKEKVNILRRKIRNWQKSQKKKAVKRQKRSLDMYTEVLVAGENTSALLDALSKETTTEQNVQPQQEVPMEQAPVEQAETESTLLAERDASNKQTETVDPLIEEAKKYNSAEDFVDEADFSDEYVFHRGSDPKNAQNIILAADDRAAIGQYGETEYLIPKNNLIDMPDWVQIYAEKYYKEEFGDDYENMSPPNSNPGDIVDSADVWDDPSFVSEFWQENESELLDLADKGIFGFKTNDGAVLFQNENIPYKTKAQLTEIWNQANEKQAEQRKPQELLDQASRYVDGKNAKPAIINPAVSEKQKQAVSLGELFGLDVVYYSADTKSKLYNTGGFTSKESNTIFVNNNDKNPIMGVLGHEITHQLSYKNPKAYDFLKQQLEKNTDNLDTYKEFKKSEKGIHSKLGDESIINEFISDFGGEQFQNPAFWAKMHKENATLTEQIIDFIISLIDKIKNSDSLYADNLQEAQDALISAMSEFSKDANKTKPKQKKKSVLKKKPQTPTDLEEARLYDSAEEFVDDYINSDLENSMQHRPTFTRATADNITQEVSDMGLPEDFYDNARMYENLSDKATMESFNVLKKIKGNPEAEITIYRASPKNELRIGDWVTLSKKYAKGESATEGVNVHSFKVKAKDIHFAGDSINEFGYYPKAEVDRLTDVWNKANSFDFKEGDFKGKEPPTKKRLVREYEDYRKSVQQIFSPNNISAAVKTSLIKRKAQAAEKRKNAVTHKKIAKAIQYFDYKMSKDDSIDFIKRMEAKQKQKNALLDSYAELFNEVLAEGYKEVSSWGEFGYIEYYFPHLFKDPKLAREHFGYAKGLKPGPFKQKRKYTLTEALDNGLELAFENPAMMVLQRSADYNRYVMGSEIMQELKDNGIAKFVPASMDAKSYLPSGYKIPTDGAFSVEKAPITRIKEAYDKLQFDQLLGVAKSLGIKHERSVSNKHTRDKWGLSFTGADKIWTKFAGPAFVLAHEIGHQIGDKFHLYDTMLDYATKEETTKGKQGKSREALRKEWRALADLHYETIKDVPEHLQKYVRKKAEKEAAVFEAWIAAPDKMEKVAPTLTKYFKQFLASDSRLEPLLHINRSMVKGVNETKIEQNGIHVLGHWAVPEDSAMIINRMLAPGLFGAENKSIRNTAGALRVFGNAINQTTLALSAFHAFNVGFDASSSMLALAGRQFLDKNHKSGLKTLSKVPFAVVSLTNKGAKLRKQILSDHINNLPPEIQDFVKIAEASGWRFEMDSIYKNNMPLRLSQTIRQIKFGTATEKTLGVAKMPIVAAFTFTEFMAKPLMEILIPNLKTGLFAERAQYVMEQAARKGLTADDVAANLAQVADSVENRMGQMTYDNLNWNKVQKDMAQLAFRSLGWNLGSIREFGGGLYDTATIISRLKQGDQVVTDKMLYSASVTMLYALSGAVIMKMLTGNWPDELKDYFYPKTGKKNNDGSDQRLNLPFYSKDWFAFADSPSRTIKHKLHPMWGVIGDMWSNENYYGTEIWGKDDPLLNQLKDMSKYVGDSFLPFSYKNFRQLSDNGVTPGVAALTSLSGIGDAPRYITQTTAQKTMLKDYINQLPRGTRTRKQFEYSLLRKKMIRKIQSGQKLTNDEKSKFRPAQYRGLYRDAKLTSNQSILKRLALEKALNVLSVANDEELKEWYPIVRTKYQNRKSPISSDQKKLYIEQRKRYIELIKTR